MHAYCTPEYTLTAMLAGTYSVAALLLQRPTLLSPKAIEPIVTTLVGMVMLVKLLQM